jgi:tetratricopeptide (TPR) repeat protein
MYDESRAIYVAADDHWNVAVIDLFWASVCAERDLDRSRQLYQSSLDFFTTCGDRILAGECLRGLAQLHDRAGNPVEAARLWRERLAIAQERNDQWSELVMWAVLGRQATRLGHYEEAKYCHHQSLSIVQNLGHLRMTADQLDDLARAELLNGELAAAEQHLKQSVEILEKVDDPAGLVEAYVVLGDVALARGDVMLAGRQYQVALDSANVLPPEDYTQPASRVEVLTGLGKVALAERHAEVAREYLREAVSLIPQVPPEWRFNAMNTLIVVAQLVARDQPRHIMELLAFVIAQPLTYQHVRTAAQRLLRGLATEVPADEVRLIQQHGERLMLDEAITLARTMLAA